MVGLADPGTDAVETVSRSSLCTLVAVTGSRYTDAVTKHALDIAGHDDASIHMMVYGANHAVINGDEHDRARLSRAAAGHQALSDRQRRLERSRELIGSSGPHQIATVASDPFNHLVDQWRFHDLTILGQRDQQDSAGRMIPLLPVNDLLVAGVSPILAVAPHHRPITSALVAIDHQTAANRSLKRFLQLGLWQGIEIHFVHFGESDLAIARLLERAALYAVHHGATVGSMDIRPGSARDQLLAHQRQVDADLLIMGHNGHGSFYRTLFGSTLDQVLSEATRPVFITT